ncbi:THAP domain-containing protein 3-like [Ornithodoros turicata]|uniref:THAP domain-containing protein 3-like n=1 Tax=Ornithodoros turicata TaxID=34597 RepID=UPI00313A1702
METDSASEKNSTGLQPDSDVYSNEENELTVTINHNDSPYSTDPFHFPTTLPSFSREPSLRLSWEHAIGRPDLVPTKHSVVCSKHFRNEDFDRTSLTHVRVRLREGAVPIPSLQVQQLLGKEPDVAGVSDPEPSAQELLEEQSSMPGVSMPEPSAQEAGHVHEVADMPSVPPSPALKLSYFEVQGVQIAVLYAAC